MEQDAGAAAVVREVTAGDVYRAVLKMTNGFLIRARGWEIHEIRAMENPTLEQVAKELRTLVTIMRDIKDSSYEDDDMEINALQCLLTMEEIVNAVMMDKPELLPGLVRRLEGHNGAPCH